MIDWFRIPPEWFRVHDDPKANAANWQGTLCVLIFVILPMIVVIVVGSIIY